MIVRFGGFTLDAAQRQLRNQDGEVRLTPMAFNLLTVLATDAPRVVPKQELHARLWPDTFVSEATLTGLVKELRRALGDRDTRTTIRTVNRVGFAIGVAVERPSLRSDTRHWLTVAGKRVLLRPGTNLIGRDPEAGVWLDFVSVSRRHALIVVEHDDVRLEDLGSKNGTTVGDRRVANPVALQDGDQITVGSVTMTYHTSASGPTTETSTRIVV